MEGSQESGRVDFQVGVRTPSLGAWDLGGGLASIGQLEKVREGFRFWTRSQVQARDMRTRTR